MRKPAKSTGDVRLRTASALNEAVLRDSKRRPFRSERTRLNKTCPTQARRESEAVSVHMEYVDKCLLEVEILRSRFPRRETALRSILHISQTRQNCVIGCVVSNSKHYLDSLSLYNG